MRIVSPPAVGERTQRLTDQGAAGVGEIDSLHRVARRWRRRQVVATPMRAYCASALQNVLPLRPAADGRLPRGAAQDDPRSAVTCPGEHASHTPVVRRV